MLDVILYFSLSYYATTNTEDSVYVIGGRTGGSPSKTTTIAKYKDDIWTIAGNLKQARYRHGVINVEGRTMIIAGSPESGTPT